MIPAVTQRQAELDTLCRRRHVRRLEVFGPAATGGHRAGHSELDFLVEFEPLLPGTCAETCFGLLDALEQLFEQPVDVVVASAIRDPYFRQSAEQSKALLHAACSQRHRASTLAC